MLSKIGYPWFFFYRIARLSLLVFLPSLFLILFLYRGSYKQGLVSQMSLQIEESLKTTQATLVVAGMDWKSWCEQVPKSDLACYSLVDAQGNIICDSRLGRVGKKIKDPSEINEALIRGFSSRVRYSDYFKTQAVFAGMRITPNLVIRKLVPITSLKDDMNRFDRVLFLRIVPFAVLSYIIFLFLFYRSTRPLGTILSKVEKFRMEIPFNKSLELLYKKNEWEQIEEALNEADEKIKTQVRQVESENKKIAAILESINDGIIAIDKFESILFYNTNFKNNFIRERSDKELVPKIWHSFDSKDVLDAFKTVMKNGEASSLKSLNFPTSHSPNRFFDLTITPLRDPEGKITGSLGVFYDVTEFKLTEQMRVDFVANVSHEIRTPLTSIKGYTQILESQKKKIDPELHLFLEKITSNTERMISLFNDLLNLSVIESKNLVKFEELNLSSLIEMVSENIMTNYPNKDISIIQDIKQESIRGDQRLMEQVLSNLLDNACKYAGDKITITISSTKKNGKAQIAVADNGPGISQEHIQRIFERFYRIDSSRESSRGTGLGLSIVKHIIAKHGGKIWAESTGNTGAKFIVELPLP